MTRTFFFSALIFITRYINRSNFGFFGATSNDSFIFARCWIITTFCAQFFFLFFIFLVFCIANALYSICDFFFSCIFNNRLNHCFFCLFEYDFLKWISECYLNKYLILKLDDQYQYTAYEKMIEFICKTVTWTKKKMFQNNLFMKDKSKS